MNFADVNKEHHALFHHYFEVGFVKLSQKMRFTDAIQIELSNSKNMSMKGTKNKGLIKAKFDSFPKHGVIISQQCSTDSSVTTTVSFKKASLFSVSPTVSLQVHPDNKKTLASLRFTQDAKPWLQSFNFTYCPFKSWDRLLYRGGWRSGQLNAQWKVECVKGQVPISTASLVLRPRRVLGLCLGVQTQCSLSPRPRNMHSQFVSSYKRGASSFLVQAGTSGAPLQLLAMHRVWNLPLDVGLGLQVGRNQTQWRQWPETNMTALVAKYSWSQRHWAKAKWDFKEKMLRLAYHVSPCDGLQVTLAVKLPSAMESLFMGLGASVSFDL